MYLLVERAVHSAALLCCLLSQALIISGINEYVFITQPPTELQCNPYISSDNTDFLPLGLECSIGILGKTEVPVDTRIVWFRRANGKEEQLCDSEVATAVAATPLAEKHSVLLRSKLNLRPSPSIGNLNGSYWCQVLKIDGSAALSNESSVLLIQNSQYYHRRKRPNCTDSAVFLELSLTLEEITFGSSSSVAAENYFCPSEPNSESTNSTSGESEGDGSLCLPRMLVYIVTPVVATLVIGAFLFLFIALIIMCVVQKKESRKKHLSTIGLAEAIEIDTAINSDTHKPKSNGSPGNETGVMDIPGSGQTPTTPKSSTGHVGVPVHLKHTKPLLNNQRHHQENETQQNALSGGQDSDTDEDEEYYYTHIPPKNDRKAKDLIGKLKGACTGSQVQLQLDSAGDSDGNDGGNMEYHSLDPDAMDPSHTYSSMQASNPDGPQPTYSEPDVHGRKRRPPLPKGHKPSPPKKIPHHGHGRSKAPLPRRSIPSVNSDYITPNDSNAQYQGLSPSHQEYLNLYVTPGSAPQ